MGFFDDIEDMFSQMNGFENRNYERSFSNVESPTDYIETPKNIFLVLDFSTKDIVDVKIKDNNFGNGSKKLLEITFSNNETLNYSLPREIKAKNFEWKFNNGILEAKFRKWTLK